mmetsp:Transcript_18312/g.33048  ORF Transcript_18312/g.33048 Transcript_18312/m.33048 type:complete len:173 (-) Transcript_18312:105-623(-)
MSVIVQLEACPVVGSEAQRPKRVQFCSMCQVKEVAHKIYPSDYFYTSADYARFRKEAREEKMGATISPVQRAFNVASSSFFGVLVLIVGLIATTIACLPILLFIKLSSVVFSHATQEDVDSSIQPYPPSTDPVTIPLTERLLLNLLGDPSLSFSSNGASQFETLCVSPLISN